MEQYISHLQAWLAHETPLVSAPAPLFLLSVCLLTGFVTGRLAHSTIHLPALSGQILGGVAIGHYFLNIFPQNAYTTLEPIMQFALGFIGLTIGSFLDFRKLHNAGLRIAWITFADALFTPVLVFVCLFFVAKVPLQLSVLLAAIALSTAPESVIHVVREERGAGMFTKTLLAVTAVNSALTIIVFYLAYYYLVHHYGPEADYSVPGTIAHAALMTVASGAIGYAVGSGVIFVTEKHHTRLSFLTIVVVAVFLTVGLAQTLKLSGVLASLLLGITIANRARHRHHIFGALHDIEGAVFVVLFVMAGMHLDLAAVYAGSAAGMVLIASRAGAKTLASVVGGVAGRATPTTIRSMAISLYPLAGIALGLVVLCENTLEFVHHTAPELGAVVLTAVIANELAGPLLTRLGIRLAGEQHKDRLRLIDFLQEEYILVGLEAQDKWDALMQMAAFLHRTHHCTELTVKELQASVIEREKQISTGLGDGLAIPHAIIEGGPKIRGVIGISETGIDFEALDGEPVHIIFLIATPEKHYDMHLRVLASLAKIFGSHPEIREQLIGAKSAAQVFEVLHAEDVEELNPFFEA